MVLHQQCIDCTLMCVISKTNSNYVLDHSLEKNWTKNQITATSE